MPEVDAKLHAQLASGVQTLGLELDEQQLTQMLRFVSELERWNRSYNLTSVRAVNEMVTRHLLDSLAVAPHIGSGPVVDIGTGAGLPGIPLSIAMPDTRFTLVDSNGKKVRFVRHALRTLQLPNVDAAQSRAEQLNPADHGVAQGFDVVVARALSALNTIGQWCQHLLSPGGRLLAMKGPQAQTEVEQAPEGFRLVDIHRLTVPGLQAERQLIELQKTV